MSVSLSQTLTAVGPGITSSFFAVGGASPYVYSVRAGGAGGTIDSSTGIYTAPATVNNSAYGPPAQIYDVVQVTDNSGARASAQILVGTPLLLVCDIIQNQMGLDNSHCYLWDQKIMQPTDSGLYVAIAVLSCKPFSSQNYLDANGNSVQSLNMYAQIQLDIISRDTEARDRKEEVVMSLYSNYSQQQQMANSFGLGRIPPGAQFNNLSNQDGAAIPYRFSIAVGMQYFVTKTQGVPYFSSFSTPTILTNQ